MKSDTIQFFLKKFNSRSIITYELLSNLCHASPKRRPQTRRPSLVSKNLGNLVASRKVIHFNPAIVFLVPGQEPNSRCFEMIHQGFYKLGLFGSMQDRFKDGYLFSYGLLQVNRSGMVLVFGSKNDISTPRCNGRVGGSIRTNTSMEWKLRSRRNVVRRSSMPK